MTDQERPATLPEPNGNWHTSALATLRKLGYTYEGGEVWKPPFGPKPDFDLMNEVHRRYQRAMIDAIAHLAGAASAYRTYAKRGIKGAKVPADAFFETRVKDFEAAAARVRAAYFELRGEKDLGVDDSIDGAYEMPEDGYSGAFYKIGEVLGFTAMAESPKDVFEKHMLPKLRQLIAMRRPLMAIITEATKVEEPVEFLNAWLHGEWDTLRREWPEASVEIYPDVKFEGVDDTEAQWAARQAKAGKPVNQCDGCRAGAPIKPSPLSGSPLHQMSDGSLMACERKQYEGKPELCDDEGCPQSAIEHVCVSTPLASCAAGRDGECNHAQCPQTRDGEPVKTGRSCPLWKDMEEL